MDKNAVSTASIGHWDDNGFCVFDERDMGNEAAVKDIKNCFVVIMPAITDLSNFVLLCDFKRRRFDFG